MEEINRVEKFNYLRMLAHSEPIIHAYLRSLVQDYHDHSEIIQYVSFTTLDKFSKFEREQEDFCKSACVVARFEAR
jgi:hypothetical protein